MGKFKDVFDRIYENEGKVLHHDRDDVGGMTYWGIARKYNPTWQGWKIIDSKDMYGSSDGALKNMVDSFYFNSYWTPLKAVEMPTPIAYSICDFAVNVGKRNAVIEAQLACGALPDGFIGDNTLSKIASFGIDDFLYSMFIRKVLYYKRKVQEKPVKIKYLKGWISRAKRGKYATS